MTRPNAIVAYALATLVVMATAERAFATAEHVDEELLKVIERLNPGNIVRVQAFGFGEFTAEWLRHEHDTLVLLTKNGDAQVPAAVVQALWVRSVATKEGAGAGGVIGLLGGLVVGTLGASLCAWGDEPCPQVIPGALVVGLLAGAGVGATVGSVVPDWQWRYRAPDYHAAYWAGLSQEECRPCREQREFTADTSGERQKASPTSGPRLVIAPDPRGGLWVSATIPF